MTSIFSQQTSLPTYEFYYLLHSWLIAFACFVMSLLLYILNPLSSDSSELGQVRRGIKALQGATAFCAVLTIPL